MSSFCTNCGSPLEEGAVFCDMCGSKLDEQPVAQPARPAQTYASPAQATQPELHPVEPYVPPAAAAQPTQQFAQVPQATQQYPQVTQQYPQITQQYAPYQPAQPPYQQNQPYAQNEGAPQNKKKRLIIGLAIAGVMLALALTLFFVLTVPMMDPHKDDPLPTNNEETVDGSDKSTDSKNGKDEKDGEDKEEESTETSTEIEAQTEAEAETETQSETQPETETEPTTETQPETEPEAQPVPPVDTPTEPAKDLPYVDSLGKPNASDFAWISDAMGGSLEGEFLSKDALLGKWKCEFIFDGIWELVYVTIDEGGTVTVRPYQINYGEGWDDESGDAAYTFNGSFDINRVYGSGENGNIDIYQFVENHGTQYGVGTLTTKNGNSAEVYLVRP